MTFKKAVITYNEDRPLGTGKAWTVTCYNDSLKRQKLLIPTKRRNTMTVKDALRIARSMKNQTSMVLPVTVLAAEVERLTEETKPYYSLLTIDRDHWQYRAESAEALLELKRQNFINDAVEWRGVEPQHACPSCQGSGVKAYATTATWSGGIGGCAITNDVCDQCWGSGDQYNKWADLRLLRGIKRRAEVAEAKADAMLNAADFEVRKMILDGRFP
jgi:hypothetical protein